MFLISGVPRPLATRQTAAAADIDGTSLATASGIDVPPPLERGHRAPNLHTLI